MQNIRLCLTEPKKNRPTKVLPYKSKFRMQQENDRQGVRDYDQIEKNAIFTKNIYRQFTVEKEPKRQLCILLVGLLSLIILMFIYQLPLDHQKCLEDYKMNKCWEKDLKESIICKKIQICMKKNEKIQYNEIFITAAAGLGFLIQKFWREIFQAMNKIRFNVHLPLNNNL